MRLIRRVTLLCLCLFAAHVIERLSIRHLHPVTALLRIPAPPFTLNEVIHAASHKYQVPAAFIKSIIAAESAFSPQVVSPKGAIGLMQLMPETARELGADPSIPEQNVEAGANYLGLLLHRYANRKHQLRDTIAAYNAGPGAVARYKGVPPYRETRAYVTRVMRLFDKYQKEESGPAYLTPEPHYLLASAAVKSSGRWRPRRAVRRYRGDAS
jgi:soluble lytic murein transglycosylase-like protein